MVIPLLAGYPPTLCTGTVMVPESSPSDVGAVAPLRGTSMNGPLAWSRRSVWRPNARFRRKGQLRNSGSLGKAAPKAGLLGNPSQSSNTLA